MQGKIIKGIAGFYDVAAGNTIYRCRAKGIFRNQKVKPQRETGWKLKYWMKRTGKGI